VNTPTCPACGHAPAWTHCHECGWDAPRKGATTDASPATGDLPDTRSEEERKRDALDAVLLLGWDVISTEQGWRPFECRSCGASIAGGTRVDLGLADWIVMGFGLVLMCEWKSGKGKPTPAQVEMRERCAVAGVPYRVVRTTAEVVAFLEETKERAMEGRAA